MVHFLQTTVDLERRKLIRSQSHGKVDRAVPDCSIVSHLIDADLAFASH